MGKFDGVLLATDYDETLYDKSAGISRENREAMAYFMAEGGYFTVSTGRSLGNFSIQMERQDLQVNAPLIVANGAQIYDFSAGRLLYDKQMPAAVIGDMAQVCAVFPRLGFEAYHKDKVYIHKPNEVTWRHLELAGLPGIEVPIGEMPAPWVKAMLQHTDKGLLLEIQGYIQEHFGQRYEAIFSNPVLLELTAKGSHKGSAVLWLAAHLSVPPDKIFCIGNGQNDLPMLKVAAGAFAPDNCAEELRRAPQVTILPSCEESCVARLIELLDKDLTK